ncbi:hypothetical protein MMC30_007721 [Trapelia coarctata]|nr:hypothetical protein [Trapelia coarctata]
MWSRRKTPVFTGMHLICVWLVEEAGRAVPTNLTAASTLRDPDLLSILPYSSQGTGAFDYAQWYDWWVHNQVQRQPKELFSTLPNYDPKLDERWTHSFVILWQKISGYMKANDSVSIDDIIAFLVEHSILQPASNSEALLAAKNLVFAVIGWQTMLYRPDMHSCPPVQLAIDREMGVHQGQAHICLKQGHSACKKHMHEFLLGFGVMLPPPNFNTSETSEDKTAFNELKTAMAASFNAHLLASIGDIHFEWVDSLSCHLEFDTHSKTLFLFRYPSFCLANLSSSKSTLPHNSVIHACAAPCAGMKQWATADEVTQMLNETLQSYRLLFGQNKAARQLFRRLRPFENIPEAGRDRFLMTLCGQKHCRTTLKAPERESYDLPHDFPILRSRLAILLRHLSNKKPRTWKEIWQDKRDSASWLTFWAVLVIGGLGIILTLLQVVLQIVQIARQ